MRRIITVDLKGYMNAPAFRPFIWKMAVEAKLGGWVAATPDGARLRLSGEEDVITEFLRALPVKLPRAFHLTAISLVQRDVAPPDPPEGPAPFKLLGPPVSGDGMEADKAPCPDCVRKMLDPESRFYHYPFVSCRNCGPRYSIATMAPFNRRNSAFMAFPPCKECAEEEKAEHSGNPNQTCPVCGPSALLMTRTGEIADSYSPLETACDKIQKGGIISVKTYDGFITLCDALNRDAVAELRRRKNVLDKPVSIMVRDLEVARRYCICSELEEQMLTSPAAPVVILRRREDAPLDPDLFCPDFPETLGLAMAPTAMLRLLFESRPTPESLQGQFDAFAFVGGPKPVDPDDAGGDSDFFANAQYSDYILTHDLKIWQNGGSSVQLEEDGKVLVRRRSRGICPTPLKLNRSLRRVVLALGSDRASAVALGYRNNIAVSQQMGSILTDRDARALSLVGERLLMLYAQIPDILVCDMDVNTLSSAEALRFAERCSLPLATAQRHHANALACMAEHALPESLALILDGGAYGPDGAIWGAEMMDISPSAFRRLATFSPLRLPEPPEDSRALPSPGDILLCALEQKKLPPSETLLRKLALPPESYSASLAEREKRGRIRTHAALPLFEAVAAAIREKPSPRTYDSQVLVRMDAAIWRGADAAKAETLLPRFGYELHEDDGLTVVNWTDTIRSLQDPSWMTDFSTGDLLYAFFLSVARALGDMAELGRERSGRNTVVLSGSVFLNRALTRLTRTELQHRGFEVRTHEKTSPDQSSVCIGQAVFGGMS